MRKSRGVRAWLCELKGSWPVIARLTKSAEAVLGQAWNKLSKDNRNYPRGAGVVLAPGRRKLLPAA